MITERHQEIHNKVCEERDQLKKENAELKAYCEQLKAALVSSYSQDEEQANKTIDLLVKSPSLCLKEHDAQVIEEVISFFLRDYENHRDPDRLAIQVGELRQIAQQLKEETKDE